MSLMDVRRPTSSAPLPSRPHSRPHPRPRPHAHTHTPRLDLCMCPRHTRGRAPRALLFPYPRPLVQEGTPFPGSCLWAGVGIPARGGGPAGSNSSWEELYLRLEVGEACVMRLRRRWGGGGG